MYANTHLRIRRDLYVFEKRMGIIFDVLLILFYLNFALSQVARINYFYSLIKITMPDLSNSNRFEKKKRKERIKNLFYINVKFLLPSHLF